MNNLSEHYRYDTNEKKEIFVPDNVDLKYPNPTQNSGDLVDSSSYPQDYFSRTNVRDSSEDSNFHLDTQYNFKSQSITEGQSFVIDQSNNKDQGIHDNVVLGERASEHWNIGNFPSVTTAMAGDCLAYCLADNLDESTMLNFNTFTGHVESLDRSGHESGSSGTNQSSPLLGQPQPRQSHWGALTQDNNSCEGSGRLNSSSLESQQRYFELQQQQLQRIPQQHQSSGMSSSPVIRPAISSSQIELNTLQQQYQQHLEQQQLYQQQLQRLSFESVQQLNQHNSRSTVSQLTSAGGASWSDPTRPNLPQPPGLYSMPQPSQHSFAQTSASAPSSSQRQGAGGVASGVSYDHGSYYSTAGMRDLPTASSGFPYPSAPSTSGFPHSGQHYSTSDKGMKAAAPLEPPHGQLEASLEHTVVTSCREILQDASKHSLKAVELANTLRARVGTEVLGVIRERWGGLLSLLERHADTFRVERIPKNDCVTLVTGSTSGVGSNVGMHTSYGTASGSGMGGFDVDGHTSASHFTHVGVQILKDGQASNCLHVGNVPPNITEAQLRREFERYGQLECLNIVSQRNRRFAFVSYSTVEQAMQAKHRLSRTHPWKSAISFARKDNAIKGPVAYGRNVERGYSMPVISESEGPVVPSGFVESSFGVERGASMPVISPSPSISFADPGLGLDWPRNRMRAGSMDLYTPQRGSLSPLMEHTPGRPLPFSSSSGSNRLSGMDAMGANSSEVIRRALQAIQLNKASQQQQQAANEQLRRQQVAQENLRVDASGRVLNRQSMSSYDSNVTEPSAQASSFSGGASLHFDPSVLRRLCDDTYVPTQIWPLNSAADFPFCEVIVSQLLQLGGSSTVSKLRGALRHRICAQDNIKSVPLKALLAAYPEYFILQGNHISISGNVSTSLGTVVSEGSGASLGHSSLDPL